MKRYYDKRDKLEVDGEEEGRERREEVCKCACVCVVVSKTVRVRERESTCGYVLVY